MSPPDVVISQVAGALLQVLLSGEVPSLDLIARLTEKGLIGHFFGPASVYSALRELERGGLISSREGPPVPERGGRARRYYALTETGRKAAAEAKEVP